MFRGTKNVPNYDIPLKDAGALGKRVHEEDMTIYLVAVPSNFLERHSTSRRSGWRSFRRHWISRSLTPSARSSRTSADRAMKIDLTDSTKRPYLRPAVSEGPSVFVVGDRVDGRPEQSDA